jgi:putative transposase
MRYYARFPHVKPRNGLSPRGRGFESGAALRVLYLVATQQRKNRQDMTGKINGWKTILNTLTVHYGDRIAAHTIS